MFRNFATVDSKIVEKAWRCIAKSAEALHARLLDVFEDHSIDDDAVERRRLCNILKMTIFIFCHFVEKFEEQEATANTAADVEQMSKGGRKKTKRVEPSHEWEKSKERGMDTLMKITVMPLHRLFTPPVVEEEFVK